MCALVPVLLAMITNAAPASAADLAPLPDGFKSETPSAVPGLYAHGIDYHDRYVLEKSLSTAESACSARGRRLEYLGDRLKGTNTQYWLYRTGNDAVVFESSYTVKIDPDLCQATFTEKRKVTRSTEKVGAWPPPFHGGAGCSWFSKACYTETKSGIKRRCRAEGNGFQGTLYCVSIDRGPSRGLLLESGYWSDDMSGFGFNVTDVKGNASLDASLFDRSRDWAGKEK